MVIFFKTSVQNIIAVQADHSFSADETKKLSWLFDNAELLPDSTLKGWFIGPRKEMITIVDKQEYRRLMDFVRKTDPKAFVTVYSVSEMRYTPKK